MKKIRKKQRRVLLVLAVSCVVLISGAALIGFNFYTAKQVLNNSLMQQAQGHMEGVELALAMEHKESSVSSVVTMSFGIASMVVIEPEEVKLIRIADECLYKAKAKGRNCAVSKQI